MEPIGTIVNPPKYVETPGQVVTFKVSHRAHWGVQWELCHDVLHVCSDHLVAALSEEGINEVWSLDPDDTHECCCPGWH